MTSKAGHTAGPWEYVPGNEHHGPYVAGPYGGDICDCYAMSNPMAASIRNGGTSYPINHQGEAAEANARLIAEAGTVAHETGLTPRQLAEQREELLGASTLFEKAEEAHANCDECGGEEVPELCPKCFPLFDDARLKRRAAIAKATAGGAV